MINGVEAYIFQVHSEYKNNYQQTTGKIKWASNQSQNKEHELFGQKKMVLWSMNILFLLINKKEHIVLSDRQILTLVDGHKKNDDRGEANIQFLLQVPNNRLLFLIFSTQFSLLKKKKKKNEMKRNWKKLLRHRKTCSDEYFQYGGQSVIVIFHDKYIFFKCFFSSMETV